MTDRDLAKRVAALEARLNEDTRLVAGVERLSDETAGLNAILSQVDEQQQRLSTLGRDLERVKKSTVSKEDLDKQRKAALAREAVERKKRTHRFTAWGISGLAALTLIVLAFTTSESARRADEREYRESVRQACEGRTKQAQVIAQVFSAFEREILADPTLTQEQKDQRLARNRALLSAFPVVNCGALK